MSLALSRSPWRDLIASTSIVTLLAALLVWAVLRGAYELSPGDIFSILTGGGDALDRIVVIETRLPRILAGLGVGAALGIAGAITQTMLRNPLAAPDIIGISQGAAFGAIAAVILLRDLGFVTAGATIGGLAAAGLTFALARRGGLPPLRLILIGIGVNLSLTAACDVMIAHANILEAADLTKWLVGTLNNRNWQDAALMWGGLTCAAPFIVWAAFPLARLGFGDDVLTGLGLRLGATRTGLVFLAVALVSLSISVAGPLPFVALVATPIARGLSGRATPGLGLVALVGAAVTLLADIASTRAMPGYTLPAGVFTAIIGAPVLLWLLVMQIAGRKL